MKKSHIRHYILALAALLVLSAPFGASATTIRSGETITVEEKLSDDVYAAGENITAKADIEGDLVGFAGTILAEGRIASDAFVAGGTVTLGSVGDDLRAAGGALTLNGEVGDDAFIAGGTITLGTESLVKGSLSVAGGVVTLSGTVDGTTNAAGGEVHINGTLNGPVTITADRITVNGKLGGETRLSAREVVIADGAELAGTVRYWQEKGPITADAAIVEGGSFTYDEALRIQRATIGVSLASLWMYLLFSLLAGALVLILFVLFEKGRAEKAARTLSAQYWKSLLNGLVFYIVTPIVGIVLLVTVIGIPLGLFVLVGYLFVSYAAPIITALVLTKWIDLRRTKQFNKWTTYFVALGILIVLRALAFIPFFGGLVVLAIVPAVIGSLLTKPRASK